MSGHVHSAAEMVDQLIDGHSIASDLNFPLADRYVIAVLKLPNGSLESFPCSDVLLTCRDGVVVALLADVDPESTRSALGRLSARLPNEGWVAVAHRPVAEIAEGYREAVDTARLLAAGRRPGGTYRMTDMLVEYAATRDRAVADQLAAMIAPLRGYPLLWATLTAWIDTDRNRNQAAKQLFVHRNTLNYRLGRVTEITGVDPTTGRGLQQLAIAMIAESIRGS